MAINIDKFRALSPYYSPVGNDNTIRDVTVNQARTLFDYYQESNPNTFKVYVNGSTTPILGTMQDVTDLELRTDTKWMLTSLNNKIYMGDMIQWGDKKWMCMYDKQKNTDNCYRVKIQPCNAKLKFATFDMITNLPTEKEIPIITNVYLTDLQYFTKNITLTVDMDMLGVSLPYNEYTKKFDKQSRIYLYGKAWEIAGVDYTNIDFINGTDKGFLRWMIKPDKINEATDEKTKEICDYWTVFDKNAPIVNPVGYELVVNGNETVTVYSQNTYVIELYNNNILDTTKTFSFNLTDLDGNIITHSNIVNSTTNNCTIKVGNTKAKVLLTVICNEDATINKTQIITIKGLV